jgi:hypothetical protein
LHAHQDEKTYKSAHSAAPLSIASLLRLATAAPGRDPTKQQPRNSRGRHHLSKLQAVVVENSLDVTRVVMEYLTKKLPKLVVAMPK